MRKLGMVLLVALSMVACSDGKKTLEEGAATTASTATTVDEGFPEEGVTTTSKPVAKKLTVGQGGTLYDNDTKKDVLKVAVTKVEFSGGDEFTKPERGVFLGVYIKVKALANDQNSLAGDFYVVMRGHHYDADACCLDRFEPTLDYVDLNEGETAEGWQMFDVPARHGVVVLGQSFGGGKIAEWSF